MYVILSVAEGNEKKRTTFLDVPPNRFGCRGDDNERTNERERTSTPPPPTLRATGKGGEALRRHNPYDVLQLLLSPLLLFHG